MPTQKAESNSRQQSTGIPGLDEVLAGGLVTERAYLVEGEAGSGKTTLGLQWLLAGAKAGEPVLYLALAETKDEIEEVAESHDWSLKGIELCESVVPEETLKPEEQYAVFQPTDVELNETTRQLLEAVDRIKPTRVVIDPLSEMRLLAQNPFRHRQQIVALKRYLKPRGCTVMMLDDSSQAQQDLHLQTAAHGVIQLHHLPPEYGPDRRRLRVLKMRAKDVSLGYHDFVIRKNGLTVFPRLVAAQQPSGFSPGQLKSGIAELDALMAGGPRYGRSLLVMGSAGTGKSSLSDQFAVAAARRGERAAVFTFEELVDTRLTRSDGMQLGVREQLEAGRLTIEQIDPGQLSPGEFAAHVRRAVERPDGMGAKVVVIDSLGAYMHATPGERFLSIHFHELLSYLGQRGVVTIVALDTRGQINDTAPPVDITYLADNVLLLRFFESAGEIRTAVAAIKMRSAGHERTIRELRLTPGGIHIGEPLRQFQGILTGEPTFLGEAGPLLKAQND